MRTWAEQLMIYDKGDSDLVTLAKEFEKESVAGLNKAEQAYSARDFSLILNRYCNLKQVIFYTHGRMGSAYLPGGGVTKDTAPLLLAAPHSGLFSGPGRVLFAGCNIGEGDCGRDFLIAAGQSLLKGRGGFVGGSTSKTITLRWGLADISVPAWGQLRVVQLDATGKVVNEKLF